MTENLAEMIKNMENTTTIEEQNHVSEAVNTENETQPEENNDTTSTPTVSLKIATKPFIDWFEDNRQTITNVSFTRLTLRGINSRDVMAFTVPIDSNEEVRDLFVFKDASTRNIINLPAERMNVFFHDIIKIVYKAPETFGNIYIKSYVAKPGLINVFCFEYNNGEESLLIPYAKNKSKKTDTEIEVILPDVDKLIGKLSLPAATEDAQVLYKQIQKYVSTLTTNLDLLKWFIGREVGVIDINHLLVIDDTLIHIFNQ